MIYMKDSSEKKQPVKRKKKSVKTNTEQKTYADTMVVFAIDSSFRCPGFAVFAVYKNKIIGYNKFHLNNGTNETKDMTTGQILKRTYGFLDNECKKEFYSMFYKIHEIDKDIKPIPFIVVREKAFNSRGSQSEIKIFETVGILDYFLAEFGYLGECEELYPVTVKKQMTGTAKATKQEVAEALIKYVGKQIYVTDDESDATAVGISFMLKNSIIKSENEGE